MFQRVYGSLPTSVFDRVGVLTELLCVRYGYNLKLCLVVMKLILLFGFYVWNNVYTFYSFYSLFYTFVRFTY